jgi:NADH-quinone oxidoreductase subunit N
VIAAFYYLNVVRYMFFEPATEDTTLISPSPALKVTLAVSTAMTLIIGLYVQPFIELVQGAARMLSG